jgi:lambda repressor-like predicted transcriptional regulator
MNRNHIKFLLGEAESSFADIARSLGCTLQTVSQVCDTDSSFIRTSPRVEIAVAKAIKKPLHEVFPGRWDANGNRLRSKRQQQAAERREALKLYNLHKSLQNEAQRVA